MLAEQIISNWDTSAKGYATKIVDLFDAGYPAWTVKTNELFGVAIPLAEDIEVSESFSGAKLYNDLIILDGSEQKNVLLLTTEINEIKYSFATLCAELVTPGENGDLRKEVTSNPVTWWMQWKELLGNRNVEDRVYDALGELCTLKHLAKSGEQAIWNGPNSSTYDIDCDSTYYEVKSTIARKKRQITLSNHFQLDPPDGKKLKIVLCQFEPAKSGYCIDDLVDELVLFGYSKTDLNEKLEKIQSFNDDDLKIKSRIEKINKYYNDLESSTEITINEIEELKKYQSKYNSEIFNEINTELNNIITLLQSFDKTKQEINKEIIVLKQIQTKFTTKKEGFIDEFEKIKREINQDLNPDTYLKLNQNKAQLEESIKNFQEKLKNINTVRTRLTRNLKKRRELIMKVNSIYKERIEKINESQNNIQIEFIPNGNKEKFLDDVKALVRGSGMRGDVINQLEKFYDYLGIMEDIYLNDSKELKKLLKDSDIEKINNVLKTNLNVVCEYVSENNVEIKYHDKPLKNHSLGQRASAIILFIIEQKDNDLIIIDQPEDDLDNQVIYKELITTIRKKKIDIQFVFSTHNANIPVLGDAEQIICIKDTGSDISINNNSIDNSSIQNDVVQIMEGGPEAFNRRQQIYKEWKINSSI